MISESQYVFIIPETSLQLKMTINMIPKPEYTKEVSVTNEVQRLCIGGKMLKDSLYSNRYSSWHLPFTMDGFSSYV